MLQFADDTTAAVLSDMNSSEALFSLLREFEKVSGLKLNVKKTEVMWIGSLKSCEDPTTYDIKLSVEKNFKQRKKKKKNVINL